MPHPLSQSWRLVALQGSLAVRGDARSGEGVLDSVGSGRAAWPTSMSGSWRSGI